MTMERSKWCCRIFPLVLILISAGIALGIWYFKAGSPSFTLLTKKEEIFEFLGTILFIAIIPIGIFYYMSDKEKYHSKARAISLLGFLPALLVLLIFVL